MNTLTSIVQASNFSSAITIELVHFFCSASSDELK